LLEEGVIDRFMSKIEFIPEHSCWEWLGAKSQSGKGYGILRIGGKNTGAHRISYQIFKGPIPKDLFVLHTCDNRGCVNPMHLFLGSLSDNVQDMYRKGRGNRPNSRKKQCPLNHPYNEENTYLYNSMRHCKKCKILKQRIRRGKT
jgi:hypothetical protein